MGPHPYASLEALAGDGGPPVLGDVQAAVIREIPRWADHDHAGHNIGWIDVTAPLRRAAMATKEESPNGTDSARLQQ